MIELKNISRIYKPRRGETVTALKDINLKFGETGMTFVLGKSGSGKSTLLNVIGGLDKYDSGDLIIQGKSSKDFKQADFDSYRNTMIGFIFQEYNVLDEFTVAQNIALALELQGKKATNEAVNEILNSVDLAGYAKRRPNELSGGQKQRVAIARALVKNPKVIMADEPTGALDSVTGRQVLETLEELSKTRLVIVVSHDREFAETYGNRIVEFKDGVIISDVTKDKVDSNVATKNITFTNTNIKVRQGYELTANDLRVINDYLSRNNKDGSIEKIFNSGTFSNTDQSLIKPSSDNYHSIKSKLPFWISLKIGASSLKHKTVRLVISILLAAAAFTMFAITDSFSAYNKHYTTAQSFVEDDVSVLGIELMEYIESPYEEGELYRQDYQFNKLELDSLKQRYSNFKFLGVNRDYDISRYLSNAFYENIPQAELYYYKTEFSGVAEMTADDINNFEMVAMGNSRLPNTFNEIAITKHMFEVFKKYGYRDIVTNDKVNINNPNDLLGQTVRVGQEPYVIVAIYDTNFDETPYTKLKLITNFSDNYMLISQYESALQNSTHNLMIVKPGFIESFRPNSGYVLDNQLGFQVFNNDHQFYYYGQFVDSVASYRNTDFKLFKNINFNSLGDNDIIISMDQLMYNTNSVQGYNLFIQFVDQSIRTYIDNLDNQIIYDWGVVQGYFNVPIGDVTEAEFVTVREYLSWIYYEGNLNYPVGVKTYEQVREELISNFNPLDVIIKYYDKNYEQQEIEARVVGVFTDYNIIDKDTFVLSKPVFNSFGFKHKGEFSVALAKIDVSDRDTLNALVNEHYLKELGIHAVIQHDITNTLQMINGFIENLTQVFLYVGIGFAVFSSLLLLNYITLSVSYKKKEIGILRAIGARGADVTGIFFKEALIIAIINLVLANIFLYVGIDAINLQIKNNFGFSLTILKFGIRQVALIIVLSVFIAFISSVIPVSKVARKRPIDAIRDK